jgi:nonsense-mediated mRNA decay protein 3
LEEDPELRSKVALYRDPEYDPSTAAAAREDAMTDDDEDDGVFDIPLEELLDDLAALTVEDGEDDHPQALGMPGQAAAG